MRRLVAAASIVYLAGFAPAAFSRDIERGTIQVNGDVDLDVSSNETEVEGSGTTDVDNAEFSVNGLYYVIRNLAVGARWSYSSEEAALSGVSSEETLHAIGPIVSYNISLTNETSVRFLGSVVTMSGEEKTTGEPTLDYDGFAWMIGTQFSYFINQSVSLDGTARYSSTSLEIDPGAIDVDNTGFGVGAGLSVYF